MNKNLKQQKEALEYRLKDIKSRLNGMRVQIQQQNSEIKRFKIELKNKALKKNINGQPDGSLSFEQMKRQKRNADQAAEYEKKKRLDVESIKVKLQQQIDHLERKLNRENTSKSDDEKLDKSYKELFYDLKNSIAYNMSGGGQALDVLRDRLVENGNIEASQELESLKERYNQLGEVVGFVVNDDTFDENADDIETELKDIESAENLVDEMERSLESALNSDSIDFSNLEFTKEQMQKVIDELVNVTKVKNNLAQNLDKTSIQLKAFIAKAHLFQSQKEQIRLQKGTERRLHQNISNLNSDYHQLGHRYRDLESKNELVNNKLKHTESDEESLKKLNVLKEHLELKEGEMERLNLEKNMIAQQFITLSEEADIEVSSSQSLQLLESEHKLLEQHFFEILEELETYEKE